MFQIAETELITSLAEQYGPIGIAFAAIIVLYYRQNKRLQQVEDKNDKDKKEEVEAYKQIIKEYINLVEKNTTVIGKLTGCVDSFKVALGTMKDALDRIERKSE